jgi:dTMP kinase
MKRSPIVSFEGGEGSGKTTQFDLLCQHLDKAGVSYLACREPGGTEISEEIRVVLLRPREMKMSSWTELLLFEAARAQIIFERVQPAIKAGILVLLDRFSDSSAAYQGYGRGIDLSQVSVLNQVATQGVVPVKTLYFDVDPVQGLTRGCKGGRDRIESERIQFHQRVRTGYLGLAAKEPHRFLVLNGHEPIEAIHAQVVAEVEQLLGR